MKASELTEADVGKWVTLRGEIVGIVPNDITPVQLQTPDGDSFWLIANNILEFTDPPAPVQEVGDVFQADHSSQERTLSAIVGDVCLLIGPVENGQTNGYQGARYPLNPSYWTLVRKGTPA